jgi:hypothetical protein
VGHERDKSVDQEISRDTFPFSMRAGGVETRERALCRRVGECPPESKDLPFVGPILRVLQVTQYYFNTYA